MRYTQATRNIESSGTILSSAFNISVNNKAFSVLSDGLYANKIRAIIRELACNAWDSHRVVDKAHKPIQVHLPNKLYPYLSVKDEGVGLTKDEVVQVACTYFATTKDESDDVTGCLGLGFKSPFSYTDAFTVIAIKDGTQGTYTCFLDAKGVPTISLMHEMDTTEPNGVEVRFVVEQTDFEKFVEEAAIVLQWFTPRPVVSGGSGFVFPERPYVVSGKGWSLRQRPQNVAAYHSNVNDTSYAIMGNIAYPIESEHLKGLDYNEKQFFKAGLDFHFEIGELEFTASRESLSYKEKTNKALVDRLKFLQEDFSSKISTLFKECNTLWEARCMFHRLINGVFMGTQLAAMLRQGVLWRDQTLKGTTVRLVRPDVSQDTTIGVISQNEWKKVVPRLTIRWEQEITASDRVWVLVDNGEIKSWRKTIYLNRDPKHTTLVLIRSKDEAVVQKVLEKMGNPPFERLHELPLKPVIERGSVAKRRSAPRKVFIWNYKQDSYRPRYCWAETETFLEDGGIYVDMSNFMPLYDKEPTSGTFSVLAHAVNLGILTQDVKIFGFPASFSHLPKAEDGWINAHDLIERTVTEWVKSQNLHKAVVNFREYWGVRDDFTISFITAMQKQEIKFEKPNGPLARYARVIECMRTDKPSDMQSIMKLVEFYNVKIRPVKKTFNIREWNKKVREAHPILTVLDKVSTQHRVLSANEDFLQKVVSEIYNTKS